MYSNNNTMSQVFKTIRGIYTGYLVKQTEIQLLFKLIQQKIIEKGLIVQEEELGVSPFNWFRKVQYGNVDPEYEVDEEVEKIQMYESVLQYLTVTEIQYILDEWSTQINKTMQPSQSLFGAIAIQQLGDKQFSSIEVSDFLEVVGKYGQELTNDKLAAAAAAAAAAEAERKRKRNTIIGASVGGVVFLVIIIIVIMKTSNKKRSKRQVKNKKRK
jgi:hypothetical protein